MNKINEKVFKAYDIRGCFPEEINSEFAFSLGRAFVEFLKQQYYKPGRKNRNLKILIGRDGRKSSPVLTKSLIKGILSSGADIVDIGLSTTPLFYFSVVRFDCDGGIEVTASHNPSQFNGFKIVRKKAVPVGGKTGLERIRFLMKRDGGKKREGPKGRIIKKEAIKKYVKFVSSGFKFKDFLPFKIVIDTANAVPGILIPEVFKKTPFKISTIFKKLDGSFPNHGPNPLIEKNLRFLKEKIKEKKADIGIAFDGDGDRIVFIDERGETIQGGLICALISQILLSKNKGEKIIYDIRLSNVVREVIKENGGVPLLSHVGHSIIKEKMRKEDVLFAGEFSGHFYYKFHYFLETPFFVLFKILEKASKDKVSISELIKPFRIYFHSGEMNFKVKDKEKIIAKLEKIYGGKGKASHFEGLRVDFKDWWFNVRLSNTEDLLKLVIEAKEKKIMEEKKKEIKRLISSA